MGRRRGTSAVHDRRFEETLEEVQRFISLFERTPSSSSDDLDELRLARWLAKRRWEMKAGRDRADRTAEIDRRLPGWRVTTHSAEGFARELADCAAWVREHQELPAMSARDPRERRLGKWLTSRRYDLTVSRLAPQREAALEAAIPTWNDAIGTDGDFARRLEACSHWIGAHERLPSMTAKDSVELGHANWLLGRRRALADGRLAEQRAQMLDHSVPGWRDPRDASFVTKLSGCAAWVWEHGRMPRSTADGDESRVYRWIANRRRDLAEGRLRDDRVRLLDAAIPGWALRRGAALDRGVRMGTDAWVAMISQPLESMSPR